MHAADRAGQLGRLMSFRTDLYHCFTAWPDTQFELVDALAGTATPIRSVAELMFAPVARRGWGSQYQALEHGRIDVSESRDLMASLVRRDRPLLFAIDGSTYPRRDTRYVADHVGHGHQIFSVEALLDGGLLDAHELAQRDERRGAEEHPDQRHQVDEGDAERQRRLPGHVDGGGAPVGDEAGHQRHHQ